MTEILNDKSKSFGKPKLLYNYKTLTSLGLYRNKTARNELFLMEVC